MSIRRMGLACVDKMKGSVLQKQIDDIHQYYFENQNSNKRLNQLLGEVASEIAFYQKYRNYPIEKWPIVDKKSIQQSPQDFMNPNYVVSDLIEMRTSGSTGTPLSVFQNYEKKKRVHAEIIYFNQKFGHKLGDSYIFAKAFDSLTPLQAFMKNERQVDITNISSKQFNSLISQIEKGKISAVLAYASFYREFLDYISNLDNQPNLKGKLNTIISTASYLDLESKRKLKELFDVPVIDRYSNQENGLIAHAIDDSEIYTVNTASYYVEILDVKTFDRVQPGERGVIVITDLYNESMPLIRYNLGDIATLHKFDDRQGVVEFTKLEGRIVNTVGLSNGNVITTHSVSVFFRSYPYISDFKVIVFTKAKEIDIKIVLTQSHESMDSIQEGIYNLFNQEFRVSLGVCEQISYEDKNKKEVLEVKHE